MWLGRSTSTWIHLTLVFHTLTLGGQKSQKTPCMNWLYLRPHWLSNKKCSITGRIVSAGLLQCIVQNKVTNLIVPYAQFSFTRNLFPYRRAKNCKYLVIFVLWWNFQKLTKLTFTWWGKYNSICVSLHDLEFSLISREFADRVKLRGNSAQWNIWLITFLTPKKYWRTTSEFGWWWCWRTYCDCKIFCKTWHVNIKLSKYYFWPNIIILMMLMIRRKGSLAMVNS